MISSEAVPPRTAWFACLGLPLSLDDSRAARAYLAALGCSDSMEVRPVSGWPEAQSIVRDPDWDTRWWQAEEDERVRLMLKLTERLGQEAALHQLTAHPELDAEVLHAAATIAAARCGCTDPALIRRASGAAAMAANQHALAHLAQCGSQHLFMRKYRLFEAGRWPLTILRGDFYLF